ncbi:MAG: aminomethyl-transferring glycine dehydrogenase [Actinomycetota bacterium]
MSEFIARHIGVTPSAVESMLYELEVDSVEQLISKTVPADILMSRALDVPEALTEVEAIARLRQLASKNKIDNCFIGQGYYGTITPAVIQRNLLENPGWYTSYTPYQPEISQGRLESLLNFQTVITDLTGLDIAGASLLDEATAAAEAMTLAHRSHKGTSNKFLVDSNTHPQTIAVLKTRALPIDIELVVAPIDMFDFEDVFGVLYSYPATTGEIRDLSASINSAKAAGALVVFATDLLALTVIKSPAELGADIAIGSAQRFGVPFGFGGPHAGFMAVRSGLERSLPGRLVGVSKDVHGNVAYRLALQTREQHIRREKATSNICTAQALLANISGMYAAYHGPNGLKQIANRVHSLAFEFASHLDKATDVAFFDTVTFEVANAPAVAQELTTKGILLRVIDEKRLSVAFDETKTSDDVALLVRALNLGPAKAAADNLVGHTRTSDFLTAEVFNRYHSETEMMRYLRKLMDLDLALDRTMIPLGSCTMKLNSATEMAAVTWPEFANIHPYAPAESSAGWLELIRELEADLVEITGYDAVSLQPNAGSQGEFAGLLAISAFHKSRGESHRNICLIPASAHGTNAASAVMAGMKVVVVGCDDGGYVDMQDLQEQIAKYSENLAAIMVTYPSTHGVYEETITEICELVHAAGGQVYVDGANLNALVGVAQPGKFGADVSHLNLHKTFAIPHGGGGPGVGPVAVKAHLAEFLPGNPLGGESSVGAVSAANFGSAGVLPISYAYIRMMGPNGLKSASEISVLSANYIAKKLKNHFPILYTNKSGLIAHECILDLRTITKTSGVTVDDVAKRLMDYGFHAPTMSFPVAGTLMVEPTESESLAEVDRFIDAMISIRAEISAIETGAVEYSDSHLANAPHTAESLLRNPNIEYNQAAAFPNGVVKRHKYWPPVGRIDGAFGDRNLVCTCPDISELAEN